MQRSQDVANHVVHARCSTESVRMHRWSGSEWIPAVAGERPAAVGSGTIRVATFNILTDSCPWFVELAISSKVRFEALVAEVRRLDATLLGLNEVTTTSLQMLLDSPFVRENYLVSELPSLVNHTIQRGSHGCVMLSKLPVEECHAVKTESLQRKTIVAVCSLQDRRVAFCSLHTSALQSQRNKAIRAQQISDIAGFARGLQTEGFVMLGDLNLHYLSEDGVVTANMLLDVWAETHMGCSCDGSSGFTFDAEANAMIPRYIPGEVRKMRLDRILVSQGCRLAPSEPCKIWGDKPVDASRDLFLSDHFGLVQDMQLQPTGWEGDAEVRAKLDANAKAALEPHAVSWSRFSMVLVPHIPWMIFRALGLR